MDKVRTAFGISLNFKAKILNWDIKLGGDHTFHEKLFIKEAPIFLMGLLQNAI